MADKDTKGIEEEQAFVILSDDVPAVIERLKTFEKLSGYAVMPGEYLNIVDTFYDTKEGTIRDSKNSLRVREIDGQPLVTIKGKNKAKDGSSKRSELEVVWPWEGPSPHDVAELFGMEQIQRRETTRFARNIQSAFSGTIFAELAIDEVSYEIDGKIIKAQEVELEMKSDKGMGLSGLSSCLIKKFDKALSPWNQSKFTMGTVLEYAIQVQQNEDGFLTPDSYWALSRLKVG